MRFLSPLSIGAALWITVLGDAAGAVAKETPAAAEVIFYVSPGGNDGWTAPQARSFTGPYPAKI